MSNAVHIQWVSCRLGFSQVTITTYRNTVHALIPFDPDWPNHVKAKLFDLIALDTSDLFTWVNTLNLFLISLQSKVDKPVFEG